MCLADAQREAEDLHQALHIMHSAFKDYNEQVEKKSNSFNLNRLNRNDLIDLNQFEKDKQEKISHSITDNLTNKARKTGTCLGCPNFATFDFGTFITTDVNNEKIKLKLYEVRADFNLVLKKRLPLIILHLNSIKMFVKK